MMKARDYRRLARLLESEQQARKQTTRQTKVRQQRAEVAEPVPFADFISRFVETIMRDYGYKFTVRFGSARRDTHSWGGSDTPHGFSFGSQSLTDAVESGYREYKSWRWLWAEWPMTGKRAAWATVIHEAAHALQGERGGRMRGSAHNVIWGQAVKELQVRYPFEAVEELI